VLQCLGKSLWLIPNLVIQMRSGFVTYILSPDIPHTPDTVCHKKLFIMPKNTPYVTKRVEPKSTKALVPKLVKAEDEPNFANKGLQFGSLDLIKIRRLMRNIKPPFKICFQNSIYQHCVKKMVLRGFSNPEKKQ